MSYVIVSIICICISSDMVSTSDASSDLISNTCQEISHDIIRNSGCRRAINIKYLLINQTYLYQLLLLTVVVLVFVLQYIYDIAKYIIYLLLHMIIHLQQILPNIIYRKSGTCHVSSLTNLLWKIVITDFC